MYVKTAGGVSLRKLIEYSDAVGLSADIVVLDFAPDPGTLLLLGQAGDPFRYFRMADHRTAIDIAGSITSRNAPCINLFAPAEMTAFAADLQQTLLAARISEDPPKITISDQKRFRLFVLKYSLRRFFARFNLSGVPRDASERQFQRQPKPLKPPVNARDRHLRTDVDCDSLKKS